MREKATRFVAVCGALIGAAALGLEFVVTARAMTRDGASLFDSVWRYVGYFTILTNFLVAAIMARAALRPASRTGLNTPRIEAVGISAILLVGVVYHLLLAPLWTPEGWRLLADILLHTIAPIFCAAFWLLRPHGALHWRDAVFCLVWPLGYCLYALARGAFDGWYAYPFLDPSTQSAPDLILSVAGISGGFFVGALALVALDRALARRETLSASRT
jgi:hypothetical protein